MGPELTVILCLRSLDLHRLYLGPLCNHIVPREHGALQGRELAFAGPGNLLPVCQGRSLVRPVGGQVHIDAVSDAISGEHRGTGCFPRLILLVAHDEAFGVSALVHQLLEPGGRVEDTVLRLFPGHLPSGVIPLLKPSSVGRRVGDHQAMGVIVALLQVLPHIQWAVAHAMKDIMGPLELFPDVGDVLFLPVLQVPHDVVEILLPGAPHSPKVELCIQGDSRVEQLFIREAIRPDLQLPERLFCDGVAHDAGEHGHIAGLNLRRLVARLSRNVGHGKCTGTWLHKSGVPVLPGIFDERLQELLLRRHQGPQEEGSGVLELCHISHSVS